MVWVDLSGHIETSFCRRVLSTRTGAMRREAIREANLEVTLITKVQFLTCTMFVRARPLSWLWQRPLLPGPTLAWQL